MAASAPGAPGPEYALEGSVFMAGALLQWLRDELGLVEDVAIRAIARSVPDTGGVYVVPAFTGLGAPYWDAQARGTITGLTRGTTKAHIVRAAVESLAYQVRDLAVAMEADAGVGLTALNVDGGASANDFLMQFQCDMLSPRAARPAPSPRPWGRRSLQGSQSAFGRTRTSFAAFAATTMCIIPCWKTSGTQGWSWAGRKPCAAR